MLLSDQASVYRYLSGFFLFFCVLGFHHFSFASDPLYQHQWYIHNIGQAAGSKSEGNAGADNHQQGVNGMGIQGEGVYVTIVDSGVQFNHPDLKNNIASGSIAFLPEGQPSPREPEDENGHGTAVAGIIAAEAMNGIGGRGVAPRVKFNAFYEKELRDFSRWKKVYDLSELNPYTRIYNQSFGARQWIPQTPIIPTFNPDGDHHILRDEVMEKRHLQSHAGRGIAFVKAGGNGYVNSDGVLLKRFWTVQAGDPLIQTLLPSSIAQSDPANSNFWNTVVSAYNAKDKLASYSTVGSNIFIAAPGGESGIGHPAMVTTDLMGCDAGMNRHGGAVRNQLHGGTTEDPNCDYQATMSGTSSSAPVVTGAFALIMSTNHALSARDIRHLFALTARKIDPDNPGVTLQFKSASGDEVNYQAIDPWVKNAAGFNTHLFYGFGAINLDAALKIARLNNVLLPPLKKSAWISTGNIAHVVPDASLAGAESALSVNDELTVESVQVKLTVNHARMADLAIELISPSGTRSVLQTPRNSYAYAQKEFDLIWRGYSNHRFLSHQFYGEPSRGDWLLRVIDTAGDDEAMEFKFNQRGQIEKIENNDEDGVLVNWKLRILGHEK